MGLESHINIGKTLQRAGDTARLKHTNQKLNTKEVNTTQQLTNGRMWAESRME